jgi:hypothetical protein
VADCYFSIILTKLFCGESITLGKDTAGGPSEVLCREPALLALGIDGSTFLARGSGTRRVLQVGPLQLFVKSEIYCSRHRLCREP